MSAETTIACLHCEQTRAEIRANDTICGIEGGYEYIELIAEWPRHRWADWADKDLARAGLKPEAFDKYRRTPAMTFEYIACDDLVRGHLPAAEDTEWGMKEGQCFQCGGTPTTETGGSTS